MSTLQGSSYNLQGNTQTLQGGSTATVLQPAGSPVAPAPVVAAPAPKPVARPVVQPVAQPAVSTASFYKPDPNSPQVYNANGEPVSYAQYIAQGGKADWSNVINGAVPGQAQSTQTFGFGDGTAYDINGNPVQQAQQGALSVPTTPPATPPEADPNQTRIGELTKQLFNVNTPSQQKIYQDAYDASGLGGIKSKLTDLNKTIADITAKYTAKEGDINENPFLSEASRVGRLNRLNNLKQAEIGNLVDEYKSYADLYNQGIEEINNSVSRQVADFNSQRQVGTEELNYLLGIQQDQQAQQEKSQAFALDRGISEPYYRIGNLIYSTSDNQPKYQDVGGEFRRLADGFRFSSEKQFFNESGITSWNQIQDIKKQVDLKNYPASYQEYLLAKSDGFTGSYTDYQNEDANRKRSIARAGASVIGDSGLNSKEATIFNGIVDKYNKSPLIAAADKMRGYLTTIESAGQGQSTPQKDLNLIYAYIKALDYGDSAVREGEINLGMDTGSIRQQLNAKIQKLSGGGLLDPSQRQNYISAARELINSVNAAARAKEASFASQAQVTGVGDAWNQFRNAITTSYDQPTQGGSSVDLNDLF